jgi:prophage antirepressor-like protein
MKTNTDMKMNAPSAPAVKATIASSLLGELFLFEGHAVRVVGTADEPLFVAADVCEVLGYLGNKGSDNLRHLEADEVTIAEVATGGGAQRMLVLKESAVYALVFRCRKPEAVRFRRWVTGEVLPALRKHGFYAREGMDARLARIERAKALRARRVALAAESKALLTEIERLEELGADSCTVEAEWGKVENPLYAINRIAAGIGPPQCGAGGPAGRPHDHAAGGHPRRATTRPS